jgi:putative transcriptional regulator
MVRIKLGELLKRYQVNQVKLSQMTGIRQATLSNMVHEGTKRIQISQIDAICKALGCGIGDLIEFHPDDIAREGESA